MACCSGNWGDIWSHRTRLRQGPNGGVDLLHSCKWAAWLIARFLWQRASQQVEQWRQAGQEGLVMWDESVWEKPERQPLEGLWAVRASKAKRLTHDKKGDSSPPPQPGRHTLVEVARCARFLQAR
jgi:hypothetical protein